MNWLDLVFGIILILAVVQGLVRGFSRVAISFAGTIIGLFLAAWFYAPVAARLQPYLSSDTLAKLLGFLVIFIAVQIIAAIIAWAMRKIFDVSGLSWLDRLMGGAFGVLRALVISTILLLVLMAFPFKAIAETVAGSRVAPYVIGIANAAATVAPQEVKDGFYATYERVKRLWESTGGKTLEKSSS